MQPGPQHRRHFVLAAGILCLLGACVDAGLSSDSPAGPLESASWIGAAEMNVPPRASDRASFIHMQDENLWERIAEGNGEAIIGLKAPGSARGVYGSRILVSRDQIDHAVAMLRGRHGVTIVGRDTLLPIAHVRIPDIATLRSIRTLPFIDYINPARIRGFSLADGTGCSEDAWSGSTMYSPSGDVLPVLYDRLGIDDAWKRSSGAGITVGLVDTGIFMYSQQIGLWGFNLGSSTGRNVQYLYTSSFSSPWATCSHGTRMGGIIAAPRDGRGAIGVAWRANLVSVRHNDDVVVGAYGGDAQQGIRAAAELSHIVAMAWGTPDFLDNVADEIRFWANHPTLPRLFVGAAGTQSTCASWNFINPVLFPALMDEVLAVTAIDEAGELACDAHGGSQVDLVAYYGYPTAGRTAEVLYMRGSSSATAVVAGAAALVWSHYGGGAADTRQRLIRTAANYYSPRQNTGYGAINAYKAVGGFSGLGIHGAEFIPPYTTFKQEAVVSGDGPFTYRWNNGATTKATTYRSGAAGQTVPVRVDVTDTFEGTTRTATNYVAVQSKPTEPTCDPLVQLCP